MNRVSGQAQNQRNRESQASSDQMNTLGAGISAAGSMYGASLGK